MLEKIHLPLSFHVAIAGCLQSNIGINQEDVEHMKYVMATVQQT